MKSAEGAVDRCLHLSFNSYVYIVKEHLACTVDSVISPIGDIQQLLCHVDGKMLSTFPALGHIYIFSIFHRLETSHTDMTVHLASMSSLCVHSWCVSQVD